MPKLSITLRNDRNKGLCAKYKSVRDQYKQLQRNLRKGENREKTMYYAKVLDKLPRRASKTRCRNMCQLTGRSRGMVHYKYFGMCGYQIRDKANAGRILGLVKR